MIYINGVLKKSTNISVAFILIRPDQMKTSARNIPPELKLSTICSMHLSFGSSVDPRAGVRNDVWSKIHMNGEITCMHVYVRQYRSVPSEHVRVYRALSSRDP